MSTPYLGQILIVASNFAPKGYAVCNGQLLPINQNQALFSILGTTYGGDGRTTFGLPNLQGTAVLGAGTGNGLSPYSVGQTTGSETVTLTTQTMPAHTHTVTCNSAPATATSPSGAFWAQGPTTGGKGAQFSTASASGAMAPGAVANTGSGLPHSNIQPVLVLTYVIAVQGIFPSRN